MNSRQELFVQHYLQCFNSSEAARRAGYRNKPNVAGPRLMASDSIKAEIERRIAEVAMSADEVLHRLGEQARGELRPFFKSSERWTDAPLPTEEIVEERKEVDEDGATVRLYRVRAVVLDLDALLDPEKSRLVKKFTDSPKSGLSIELHDAQAALALLGKNHKLFADQQVDITVRIRRIAEENGLDPDEAVKEAMRILNAGRS